MVQDDVGYALHFIVPRDSYNRHRHVVMPGSIDGDQTVDGTIQKQLGILVYQIRAVAMAGDEVKITLVQKMVLNPAHDHGSVALTHFRDHNPDSETSLRAQRAGEKVGTIVEFSCRRKNPVFYLLQDRCGNWGLIDNEGDGGRGEPEIIRQLLQTHGAVATTVSGTRIPAALLSWLPRHRRSLA